MDIDKFLRKYVWDDEKTPYFTPSAQLTRRQAHYELLAYSVFLTILFGAASLFFLTGAGGLERSFPAALYAFAMLCGAITLGLFHHPGVAMFLGLAPLGVVIYLLVHGLRPTWGTIDVVAILAFTAAWLRYALRVLAVCRRCDELPPD